MRYETQAAFLEPADQSDLQNAPLVIHRRADPSTNRWLIIFIHGLGGSRYGAAPTWGRFPELLYQDVPEADIGLYQYVSAAGRLLSSGSVELETEARVFATVIRDDLKAYSGVILVGHSMGGLLCKAAIKSLIDDDERDALERIAGLIMMATPQLGSLRMPGFLSWLSPDARALRPHGKLVEKINRTFEDKVALDERVFTYRRVTIPTWIVEGSSDFWVDPLSSGIGLTSSRRKLVRGSHTSIVKPKSADDPAYQWVRDRVRLATGRFKYDVFVAAAMAGHSSDAGYEQSRKRVLDLIASLKKHCGAREVFYAGKDIPSKELFDPMDLSLHQDMKALRASRHFLLYYPEKIVSSVLYEAGWALVMGKPAVYAVRDRKHLPFLLENASQAFGDTRVRVLESADDATMHKDLMRYGDQLFRYGQLGPSGT